MSIEFCLQVEEVGGGEALTVTPYLDGVSLVELARRVESAPAAQGKEADLAGAYAGLVVGADRWQDWYTGRHPQTWFGDGDSCVLGCTCGETGCWPMTTRITITDREVVWSGFPTGHRDWDLTGLGPSSSTGEPTRAHLSTPARRRRTGGILQTARPYVTGDHWLSVRLLPWRPASPVEELERELSAVLAGCHPGCRHNEWTGWWPTGASPVSWGGSTQPASNVAARFSRRSATDASGEHAKAA